MPKACLASKWAGLLPLQPTQAKSTQRKLWVVAIELQTRAATDKGGEDKSLKALTSDKESLSSVKSCMDISLNGQKMTTFCNFY